MQSKVKLSKRQIKEDKFTTFMLTSKDQLAENWQYWIVAAAVVILLIAAIAFWVSSSKAKEEQSKVSLAQAMLDYGKGDNQVAILAFTNIVDEYGGTSAGAEATYMLGKLYLDERNYEEAGRFFQMYVKKYDDPTNGAAAHAGLATIAENQGDFAQAAAEYELAVAVAPDGPLAAPLGASAVRTHLAAGNVEAARAILEDLKDKYPNDGTTLQAERIFAEKAGQ